MTNSLSSEAEKLLKERLSTGEYDDASDVIEDALRSLQLWSERDYEQAVEGIRLALESANRGEGRPAQEVFDEMRQRHGIPR